VGPTSDHDLSRCPRTWASSQGGAAEENEERLAVLGPLSPELSLSSSSSSSTPSSDALSRPRSDLAVFVLPTLIERLDRSGPAIFADRWQRRTDLPRGLLSRPRHSPAPLSLLLVTLAAQRRSGTPTRQPARAAEHSRDQPDLHIPPSSPLRPSHPSQPWHARPAARRVSLKPQGLRMRRPSGLVAPSHAAG
jgi:hypothetical protein